MYRASLDPKYKLFVRKGNDGPLRECRFRDGRIYVLETEVQRVVSEHAIDTVHPCPAATAHSEGPYPHIY